MELHKLNKEAIDGYTQDCKEDQAKTLEISLTEEQEKQFLKEIEEAKIVYDVTGLQFNDFLKLYRITEKYKALAFNNIQKDFATERRRYLKIKKDADYMTVFIEVNDN